MAHCNEYLEVYGLQGILRDFCVMLQLGVAHMPRLFVLFCLLLFLLFVFLLKFILFGGKVARAEGRYEKMGR